jgi:hypothetical protein
MKVRSLSLALLLCLAVPQFSYAACVNKFLRRSEGPRHTITLLTGKMTYQEASEWAKAVNGGQAPALEWVDDRGKLVAKHYGEVKIVRPMPVGCDGKASGVVFIAHFLNLQPPSKKMTVKLAANNAVQFEEQAGE